MLNRKDENGPGGIGFREDKAIYENARVEQDQADWNAHNNGYLERQRTAQLRLDEIQTEIQRRNNTGNLLGRYIRNMKNSPKVLTEFDEKLWSMSIDSVTVQNDGRLVFRFRDSSEAESTLD